MKRYSYYLLSLTILFISSCSNNKFEQLNAVNQLIEQDRLDSAEIKLDEVDFTKEEFYKVLPVMESFKCFFGKTKIKRGWTS